MGANRCSRSASKVIASDASASEAGGADHKSQQASPSEGGEILRLVKEVRAAMAARDRLSPKPTEKKAQTPVVGKKKKVVKKKLPKESIDRMKDRLYTFDEIPEDELPKYTQEFRDIYAANKVIADKIVAYQRALIAQYDALGFAEDEMEVTDDEEVTDDKDKVEAANKGGANNLQGASACSILSCSSIACDLPT
ncbi:unnamed protein product [Urochloa humidicola]